MLCRVTYLSFVTSLFQSCTLWVQYLFSSTSRPSDLCELQRSARCPATLETVVMVIHQMLLMKPIGRLLSMPTGDLPCDDDYPLAQSCWSGRFPLVQRWHAAAPQTPRRSWGDGGQLAVARPPALGLGRPAEGPAAPTQLCPGDALLLLPQSPGGSQREAASASRWTRDQPM